MATSFIVTSDEESLPSVITISTRRAATGAVAELLHADRDGVVERRARLVVGGQAGERRGEGAGVGR